MKKYLFVIVLMVVALPLMAQGDEPSNFNVWSIISAVLAILSTVLAVFMRKLRNKANQAITIGKEILEAGQAGIDLVETTILAGSDNVFDAAEQKTIKEKALKAKSEWSDVKVAWKVLWTKSQ